MVWVELSQFKTAYIRYGAESRTQGNERQGDSKGFRIKLLYRVCDNGKDPIILNIAKIRQKALFSYAVKKENTNSYRSPKTLFKPL